MQSVPLEPDALTYRSKEPIRPIMSFSGYCQANPITSSRERSVRSALWNQDRDGREAQSNDGMWGLQPTRSKGPRLRIVLPE